MHPAIQGEGGQLPLEHCRGIEEHPRRLYRARNHGFRIIPEVQVMRLAGGHGHQQGVTGTATGTTGALDIVGLTGRHRALQHTGEVANIDTHLQRRCGRQHIQFTRSPAVGFEVALHSLAGLARQQAGVLVSHYPLNVGMQVELAVEVTPGTVSLQLPPAIAPPARLAGQLFCWPGQDFRVAATTAPLPATQHDVEGPRLQPPHADVVFVLDGLLEAHQAGLGKRL
ncbi:hypothetical protein D3C78_1260920 [compost metagenome]